MRKSKRVAVLGSGTVKSGSPLYRQAVMLGRELAQAGFSICHGGYGGVMEAVARGCHEAGGHNTSVTMLKGVNGVSHRFPETVTDPVSFLNPWADAEIAMPSWKDRLLKLIDLGDAYIFLDGATGTLNELFFVWEMANKKLMAKPIIILGKRLRALVEFLKKDPSLKIPSNFYLAFTIPQAIKILIGCRG